MLGLGAKGNIRMGWNQEESGTKTELGRGEWALEQGEWGGQSL